MSPAKKLAQHRAGPIPKQACSVEEDGPETPGGQNADDNEQQQRHALRWHI